jgi:gamma-glutamylcyclotransferase (GGCT)/AIG2-like uncharacterized protein YtfP
MSYSEQDNRLFVYGTLRNDPSHGMNAVLAQRSTYVGNGWAPGKLYDLGAYPGLVPSDQAEEFVVGEIYSLHPNHVAEAWRLLDEYEGCGEADPEPHEYRRRLIPIRLADGQEVHAWTYILRELPKSAIEVPGGDYLTWRRKKRTA